MTNVRDALSFLGLEQIDDRLEFLKNLVIRYQLKFPFDTVLKILNHHDRLSSVEKVAPDPAEYLQFVKRHGYAGTCFHLVHALHQLLKELNYDVRLIYLEHGHYALAVFLNQQRWLIEVSYMSPLFDIYPLDAPWRVDSHRDVIAWEPSEAGGLLLFEGFGHLPGKLTRTWDGTFSSKERFLAVWHQSFQPNSPFVQHPMIARWESTSTLLFCRGTVFKAYIRGQLAEEVHFEGNLQGLYRLLEERFGVNPFYYGEALAVTHGVESLNR